MPTETEDHRTLSDDALYNILASSGPQSNIEYCPIAVNTHINVLNILFDRVDLDPATYELPDTRTAHIASRSVIARIFNAEPFISDAKSIRALKFLAYHPSHMQEFAESYCYSNTLHRAEPITQNLVTAAKARLFATSHSMLEQQGVRSDFAFIMFILQCKNRNRFGTWMWDYDISDAIAQARANFAENRTPANSRQWKELTDYLEDFWTPTFESRLLSWQFSQSPTAVTPSLGKRRISHPKPRRIGSDL